VARLPADDLAWMAQQVEEQRRARQAQPVAVKIARSVTLARPLQGLPLDTTNAPLLPAPLTALAHRHLCPSLLSYAPLSVLPPFGPMLSLALGSRSAGEHYLRCVRCSSHRGRADAGGAPCSCLPALRYGTHGAGVVGESAPPRSPDELIHIMQLISAALPLASEGSRV
jgi:hypothetical protein